MSWISNTTAKPTLTIEGIDFSPELESVTITDSSVVNSGAVLTAGTIVLAERPGMSRIEDYKKTKFGRNKEVLLDLEINGVTHRHPRGHLFIIDSTYNPEARQVELNVGCLLTMYQLTDNIENLRSFTSFELEEDASFLDLQAAVQSEGSFLWVNNQNQIQKSEFFGSDGLGSNKEAAEWVSVRDYTSLSASPLGQGLVVPDTIQVTYTWATENSEDDEHDDAGNLYDENVTESHYWLEHPANLRRTQTVCTTDGNGNRTCRDVVINDGKRTFAVTKTEAHRTVYGGPGGSLSTEISITNGPAIELLGGYFAELYSWQLARAGGVDNGIGLGGLENIVQSRNEKTYEYGPGGEVTRTVERQYRNVLSAMTQNDWRAGNGEVAAVFDPEAPPERSIRGFLTELPVEELYLQAQITTEWAYYDDRTVEVKTTLKSSAQCNGVGIYPPIGERILQNIDADNNGIQTIQRRTSRGGLLNPDQPGRNPGGGSTRTRSSVYLDESAKYLETAAGSIVFKTSVPFTNLQDTETEARLRAAKYARTVRGLVEGDAAGVRVAEAMRSAVLSSYRPGMPFSYWDRTEDVLLKLRMNATAWAISGDEAVFSTDGVFIGQSNGQVSLPSNADAVTINALHQAYIDDPSSENLTNWQAARDGQLQEPSVTGETYVTQGAALADVTEFIAIDIPVQLIAYTGNGDDGFGIVDTWDAPLELRFNVNLGLQVSGEKVSSEAQLLHVDGTGTITDFQDSLLTSTEEVIIPDLFDGDVERYPDQTFEIRTGAPQADQVLAVAVYAKQANQIFEVSTAAAPPNQIFGVRAIHTFGVSAAMPPFMVNVFANRADQVFEVGTSAIPADQVFTVARGPERPDSTFGVLSIARLQVTTSWPTPDRTFDVVIGPTPAPAPDQMFVVSVGGPDAPPIPTPTQTFITKVGAPLADYILPVTVVDSLQVNAYEPPFTVTVGPDLPNQTFTVTSSALPYNQKFDVSVFAEPVTASHQVKVIESFAVDSAESAKYYTLQQTISDVYVVTGEGLSFAAQPTINLGLGQMVTFNLQGLDSNLWITNTQATGAGPDPASFDAVVRNNGASSGLTQARFFSPGVYYYQNELNGDQFGQIIVSSGDVATPDATFSVSVGATPPTEVFSVEVAAQLPDQTFDVTVV